MTRNEMIDAAVREVFWGADTPFVKRVMRGVANAMQEEIEGRPESCATWPRYLVYSDVVEHVRETFKRLACH